MTIDSVNDIPELLEASGTVLTLQKQPGADIWYLAIRGVFALYGFAIWIWSFVGYIVDGAAGHWFLYYTHWTTLINVTYLILSFILNLTISLKVRDNQDELTDLSFESLGLSTLSKCTKIFLNTGLSMCIFVIAVYWIVVFSPPLHAISVHTHGVLGFMILFDCFTSTWRLSKRGTILSFSITLVWVIMSVIFYAAGMYF